PWIFSVAPECATPTSWPSTVAVLIRCLRSLADQAIASGRAEGGQGDRVLGFHIDDGSGVGLPFSAGHVFGVFQPKTLSGQGPRKEDVRVRQQADAQLGRTGCLRYRDRAPEPAFEFVAASDRAAGGPLSDRCH